MTSLYCSGERSALSAILGHALQVVNRRAQLMGDVGGEALEALEALGEAVQHAAEIAREQHQLMRGW